MSKTEPTAPSWTKPELVKLGQLKDVAGNKVMNADGKSGNTKDPAAS